MSQYNSPQCSDMGITGKDSAISIEYLWDFFCLEGSVAVNWLHFFWNGLDKIGFQRG